MQVTQGFQLNLQSGQAVGSQLCAMDDVLEDDVRLDAQASCAAQSGAIHAVVLWFDTEFSARFCKERSVLLTTSPHAPQTHWHQTILQLRQPVTWQHSAAPGACAQEPDQGLGRAVLRGRISCARSSQHRCLDISLECASLDAEGQAVGLQTQLYSIGMS